MARILLVDDDPFSLQLTGMVLAEEGQELVTDEGGGEVLEKLASDESV